MPANSAKLPQGQRRANPARKRRPCVETIHRRPTPAWQAWSRHSPDHNAAQPRLWQHSVAGKSPAPWGVRVRVPPSAQKSRRGDCGRLFCVRTEKGREPPERRRLTPFAVRRRRRAVYFSMGFRISRSTLRNRIRHRHRETASAMGKLHQMAFSPPSLERIQAAGSSTIS